MQVLVACSKTFEPRHSGGAHHGKRAFGLASALLRPDNTNR